MSDFNDGILPTPCLRMGTHFGDEYESIEFGDGTGYIKAAPILAKVGALHEEIDRLRDESAELRELVRDMWAEMWTCNQYACKHGKDGCYTEDGDNGGKCVLRDRMRELGVEV